MRKSLLVLMVSCVLVLIVMVAPAVAGPKWSEQSVLEESFDIGSGGTFRVDVPDADIDIREGSSDQVRIEVLVRSDDLDRAVERYEQMNLRAESSGGDVSVTADPLKSGFQHNGDFSVTVVAHLPSGIDLDLQTDDGDVRVEAADGRLSLRTSDGDIQIGEVHAPEASIKTSDGDIQVDTIVAGSIVIQTSDGDVQADRLEGDDVVVKSSDGDISIDMASGSFKISTSDGDISLGIEHLDDTTLKTGDGDISVRADSGLQADLDLRGEEVVLRNGAAFSGRIDDDMAEGALNGGGPLLRASSGDGSIVLSMR